MQVSYVVMVILLGQGNTEQLDHKFSTMAECKASIEATEFYLEYQGNWKVGSGKVPGWCIPIMKN